MDRQDDRVEMFPVAGAGLQLDAVGQAADRRHGARQADAFAEGGHQRLDVARRASLDHPPGGALVDLQKAVVGEEAGEELHRHREQICLRGAPDRASQGHDVALDEQRPVAMGAQEIAQAQLEVRCCQERACLSEEAQDVAQHAEEGGPQQVASLGKQCVEGGSVVFQPVVLAADAEAHGRGLAGYPQQVDHADEPGVGLLVEHDEARVDRPVAGWALQLPGLGVPSQALSCFEDRDGVRAVQQARGQHAGDSGTDNCTMHVQSPV